MARTIHILDNGHCSRSWNGVWMEGSFADPHAALEAFRHDEDQILALQEALNAAEPDPEQRVISQVMLQDASASCKLGPRPGRVWVARSGTDRRQLWKTRESPPA